MQRSSNTVCSATARSFPGWKRTGAKSSRAAPGSAREHAIAICCRAKAAIVARDERETGDRQLLNLGHTFGHALEAATGFSGRLLHGEAVAAGMALAFEFSARRGLLPAAEADRAIRHLAEVGLPARPQDIPGELPSVDRLIDLMAQDKKIKRGMPTFILVRGIGAAFVDTGVDRARCARFPRREACEEMNIFDWLDVLAVVVCLAASAFFSASETALTASSRAAMMRLEKQGNRDATIVNRLLATRERLLGAILFGNNFATIAASTLATGLLLAFFGNAGVIYATIAMTLLIFVVAEVLPKTAAFNAPDRMALAVAQPIDRIVRWFLPILKAVEWLVRLILRGVGMPVGQIQSILSPREELRGAVDLLHHSGVVGKLDRDMMGGVLDLRELTVSDVMVHRTKMVMLDADEPPQEIVDAVLAAPVTRLPLWRGAQDNILGVLHAKDLLRALHAAGGDAAKIDIVSLASPPWFVPDTTPLYEQLSAFRAPQDGAGAGRRRIRRTRRPGDARGHRRGDCRRHQR